eukprot:1157689-Pelagomonas_calceolata.AAC.7
MMVTTSHVNSFCFEAVPHCDYTSDMALDSCAGHMRLTHALQLRPLSGKHGVGHESDTAGAPPEMDTGRASGVPQDNSTPRDEGEFSSWRALKEAPEAPAWLEGERKGQH